SAETLGLRPRALCRVETFGLSDNVDWQGHNLKVTATSTTFSVRLRGTPLGSFTVPMLGAYNVRNALAALAVGAAVGLNPDSMREAFSSFRGVRRRLELRGTAGGVAIYDDFA